MSQTKAQLLGPVLGDVNYDSGTLFVDSTNNRVGIGTDNPTNKLTIYGNNPGILLKEDSANAELLVTVSDSDGTGIIAALRPSNFTYEQLALRGQDLIFETTASQSREERLRITSGGNIGMGTDNPQARLHVTSGSVGSGSSSYGTAIKIDGAYGSPNSNHGIGFSINNNSPSSGIYVSEINTSGSHLIFTTSTSYTTPTQVERLRISNNGDVGIGGITPNALLHVQKNSSDTDFTNETTPSAVSGVTIGNLSTGAGTFTALTLSVSSGSATQNGSIIAKATSSGTAPEIHLTQRNNSTTVSRVMISSGGKLTHSYDVVPNFAAQYGQLEITKNGASNIDPSWSYLSFHRTGQTGWQQGINGTSFVIANTSGAARDTLDGEKFRITASGNVGIGTDNPGLKLDIHGSSAAVRVFESPNGADVRMVAGGSFGYIGTYSQNNLRILSAGATAITADTSQNVGIGANMTPDVRLHIHGTNAYPATSGTTPNGFIALRNTAGATHGAYIGVANAAPWGTWIQAQDKNNLGTSYPILLNPNGGNVGIGTNNPDTNLTILGNTDGVLNLDTTDGRGAFIRFKENGTSKAWVGCSEGIGTGGDQDDLGLRAVGDIRTRTGTSTSTRIHIYENGRMHFNAGSGGFDSTGYNDSTFPGAAFALTLGGVGDAPTSVNNYGMYCNFVGSSNNALSMTGLYLNANHNTESHAIGIHARYNRDWNSYARKIGGLFQAPVRTDRYATQSINPGGGTFINTGYGDPLLPGGNQPDGTTPTSYTYGDATALWGDAYRSDNDTNNNFCASVAVKATNRSTHGTNRVGLMVATVAGADSTPNKKSTQFVEYYEDSMFKRYYARNSRKEINAYYPIFVGSTGAPETVYNTNNAVYYLQKDAGHNQYNWYFFNAVGSSSARAGRCKIDITWTTGHASGVGYGTYDVLYRSNHSDSRITVVRFTRFNQYSSNGSYYGWTGTPSLDIYETSNTGNNAGFYLRVAGYMSANSGTYDGYVMHSIKIESTESDYNFSPQPSFAWVGTSTPSDAVGTATTISAPSH